MATGKPNQLRFAVPLALGFAPGATVLLWLHLMDVVHNMAKLPPATIDRDVGDLVMIACAIGLLMAAYRFWADFVRGDYYVELMEWQDRGGWRARKR